MLKQNKTNLKTLWLKTVSMYYISGISHDQQFRSPLVEWLWFQIFHDVLIKMSTGIAIIWRFGRGWRIHFQHGLLIGFTSQCWLLSSSPCGPFCRASWVPSQYTGWPPRVIEEIRSSNYFFWARLILTCHYFYHIILVTQTNSDTMQAELTVHGCEYQDTRIIGDHLVTWLLHKSTCLSLNI